MENLGIEESELEKHSIEDFGNRETSSEIRALRFNYFSRKQQELIRQIKSFVREDIIHNREKKAKSQPKSRYPKEVLLTSVVEDSDNEMRKTRNNYKKLVDKTYFDLRDTFNERKAIEERLKSGEKNKKKAQSAVSKARVKIEEFKEKQKENLEKIKKSELKCLKVIIRPTNSASPKRFRCQNRFYEMKPARSRSESLYESEIDEKISKYEEKMQKSTLLHQMTLQTKKNLASKMLERNSKKEKSLNQDLNIVEKIQKLVMKNKTAEDRRFSYLRQQAENREKNKEKHDERALKVQSKIREREEIEEKKGKAIERKMKISSSLLQKKHENWMKELEIRSEMQRLKDEEALNNAERKKRIL
jgi:hypothetical protein